MKLIILEDDKTILIVPIYSVHYSCYASYCTILEMEEINYLYLYFVFISYGQCQGNVPLGSDHVRHVKDVIIENKDFKHCQNLVEGVSLLKGGHPYSEVTLQKSSFFEEHFYLI